jgi:hypothetical protein
VLIARTHAGKISAENPAVLSSSAASAPSTIARNKTRKRRTLGDQSFLSLHPA